MRPFLKANQATEAQIRKLKAEAYKPAIVLADLKTAQLRIDGDMYYGDAIRPLLHNLFEEHNLPYEMKNYLVKTWMIPACDELLFMGGFKTHNSEMLFNNLSFKEADFLINKFIEIGQDLETKREGYFNACHKKTA